MRRRVKTFLEMAVEDRITKMLWEKQNCWGVCGGGQSYFWDQNWDAQCHSGFRGDHNATDGAGVFVGDATNVGLRTDIKFSTLQETNRMSTQVFLSRFAVAVCCCFSFFFWFMLFFSLFVLFLFFFFRFVLFLSSGTAGIFPGAADARS